MFYPYTTYYERAVSKTLGKVAEEFGTQFTIGLGKKGILLCRNESSKVRFRSVIAFPSFSISQQFSFINSLIIKLYAIVYDDN